MPPLRKMPCSSRSFLMLRTWESNVWRSLNWRYFSFEPQINSSNFLTCLLTNGVCWIIRYCRMAGWQGLKWPHLNPNTNAEYTTRPWDPYALAKNSVPSFDPFWNYNNLYFTQEGFPINKFFCKLWQTVKDLILCAVALSQLNGFALLSPSELQCYSIQRYSRQLCSSTFVAIVWVWWSGGDINYVIHMTELPQIGNKTNSDQKWGVEYGGLYQQSSWSGRAAVAPFQWVAGSTLQKHQQHDPVEATQQALLFFYLIICVLAQTTFSMNTYHLVTAEIRQAIFSLLENNLSYLDILPQEEWAHVRWRRGGVGFEELTGSRWFLLALLGFPKL